MDNKQFLKEKTPWPKDTQELVSYVEKVSEEYNTSYNDAVYGPALAAIAAFNYTASKMGLSGFQAGYSEMLFLMKQKNLENGFSVIDFNDLLYPQNLYKFNITPDKLIRENLESLKASARKLLQENNYASEEVRNHWQSILDIPDEEKLENED